MAFPTSPTDGQKYLYGAITYIYVASTDTWDIYDPNQEAPDMSGENILAQLAPVDGAGSGLDADLLDGQSGSYYTGYTDTAIANLVDTAPGTLNTLNELAAALGDDPNFATTVTNSIATKLNSSSYTAADVLAKIKTVDGSGSGLDADTLDGLHASEIVPTKALIDALAVDAGTLDGLDSTAFMKDGIVSDGQILSINRNTGGATGINWYSPSYYSWCEYMAPPGAGHGPRGGLTSSSGSLVTSWALRSYIEHATGYGWVFEGGSSGQTTPDIKFEIRSSDGSAYSHGNITAAGDVISNSDIRLKSDIKPINNPVEIVKALNGKSYIKDDRASIGLIAQEVEEVLPQLVHTADDEMGTKSVAYGNIVAVLIEAIKEQQKQIDELKEQLNGI